MNKSTDRAHRWEYEDWPDLQTVGVELFKGGWKTEDRKQIQEDYEYTDEEMKVVLKVMEELEFRELIDKKQGIIPWNFEPEY